MTDDQIRVMAERGGVMGVVILPGYINADKEKALKDYKEAQNAPSPYAVFSIAYNGKLL